MYCSTGGVAVAKGVSLCNYCGAKLPSTALPKKKGCARTNSSSCEAAVLAKPKARLCEPWGTMPFSEQRSPRSGRHLSLVEWLFVAAPRLPQMLFSGNPRLAEPRLGLNYHRCFAACCRSI